MFGSFPPSPLVGLRLQSLLGPGSRHCYGIITLKMTMFAEFQREYAQLNADELLRLASDRQSLTDDAKSALDAEMRNRNLTSADLAKHQDLVKKNEQRETRRRNRKLFGRRRGLLAWVQFGLWALLGLSSAALVATWLAKR